MGSDLGVRRWHRPAIWRKAPARSSRCLAGAPDPGPESHLCGKHTEARAPHPPTHVHPRPPAPGARPPDLDP